MLKARTTEQSQGYGFTALLVGLRAWRPEKRVSSCNSGAFINKETN